ncbi:MAG: serine--tRNA ligase [Methylophilaceae bacterium]|nr:serine--tRNA ligase [Methylophilaceae bacterium]
MININTLRDQTEQVKLALGKRGYKLNAEKFEKLEQQRKSMQVKAQELQEQRNQVSKKIGLEKSKGNKVDELMKQVNSTAEALKSYEEQLEKIQSDLQVLLLDIPNIPHPTVPEGKNENDNLIVREFGSVKSFNFAPKDHVDIGALHGLDFDLGSKLSGARFVVMRKDIARLHRAIGQMMIDTQVNDHGYEECYTPYLVNEDSLLGTGQLPKFAEDLFSTKKGNSEESLYLIPTGEVTLTNFVRDVILTNDELPLKLTALTPCFRSEAGSYGKDTRGMIRQHQFDKVEMVQITHPEKSYEALDEMVNHAENILKKLDLPYRVVSLCTGDIGFGAAKTFDIEVWIPSQQCYREISSVSNCEDFQARRLKARFKDIDGKNKLMHTLNGSGLAVGRALVAVIENNQLENGDIEVPTVLLPYMDGLKIICVK